MPNVAVPLFLWRFRAGLSFGLALLFAATTLGGCLSSCEKGRDLKEARAALAMANQKADAYRDALLLCHEREITAEENETRKVQLATWRAEDLERRLQNALAGLPPAEDVGAPPPYRPPAERARDAGLFAETCGIDMEAVALHAQHLADKTEVIKPNR